MSGPAAALPEFRSEAFLRAHIAQTMAFYHPRAIDPRGGFFHYFRDDGTVYDAVHRHLVSSTRFVFNYAMAAREFAGDAALRAQYLDAARHGLRYLRERHRDASRGGYAWTIRDGAPEDRTQHAYGAAFVLLACATACSAGLEEAREWLDETWTLLEARYWEGSFGLYRDEADPDWHFSDYRGQNSNMHLCEGAARGERCHGRAALPGSRTAARRPHDAPPGREGRRPGVGALRPRLERRLGLSPRGSETPVSSLQGFQPGHQTEWAKLLLTLDEQLRARGTAPEWLVPRAQQLFDTAVARAWDEEYGGLCYGFAPDGTLCDDDKYFWVQAESIAAAARLARRTGEPRYWQWYERLWAYAWRHFVDHRHGAWFRILTRDNRKYSDEKSPAGKTDYHTMGACHDVLHVLRGGC